MIGSVKHELALKWSSKIIADTIIMGVLLFLIYMTTLWISLELKTKPDDGSRILHFSVISCFWEWNDGKCPKYEQKLLLRTTVK
jgi:hypothetical protein